MLRFRLHLLRRTQSPASGRSQRGRDRTPTTTSKFHPRSTRTMKHRASNIDTVRIYLRDAMQSSRDPELRAYYSAGYDTVCTMQIVHFRNRPRRPVWLSTVWVAVSIVLSLDGHPATGTAPLVLWAFHRRMERRLSRPLRSRAVLASVQSLPSSPAHDGAHRSACNNPYIAATLEP